MKKLIARILAHIVGTSVPLRLSTSLSDNQAYPQVCLLASIDYRIFNGFRRNPIYNTILEHVTEEQGAEYLKIISSDTELLDRMSEFRKNDAYGNPRTCAYQSVGQISPSTLRYVKVLGDLKSHFKTLDNLEICEIGVGYGGQCRIINACFRPASYTLVDIRPALALAQRFLDHYTLPSVVSYRTMNELAPRDYDLVISNYAFTELPRSIQDVYLAKVIRRSKRGYITYNEITPPEFNSYKANELLEIIPGSEMVREEPLTHPANRIIAWGI